MSNSAAYDLTNNWFDGNKAVWSQILDKLKPARILEVGSYEGNSTTFIVDALSSYIDLEIHCIDSWEGGIEHKSGGSAEANMTEVEARFVRNMNVAVSKSSRNVDLKIHKGLSSEELPKLLASGMQGYFDFVYIDGSHQAPDVLLDAILGFQLLRKGGIIVFDDYLWQEPLPGGTDPIRCPKIAIDAFTNIYSRKIRVMQAPLGQLYVRKISS